MITTLGPAPHQAYAIEQILARDKLAVFYGTGTGKSMIMAKAAELIGGRCLFLVPNSLIEQMVEEVHRWTDLDVESGRLTPLGGWLPIRTRAALIRQDSVWTHLILSHEALSHKPIHDALRTIEFEAIFVDESSRFRNYSNRTKHLLGLRAHRRYIFSGTPVVKSPSDLWYPMRFLDRDWCGLTRREIFNAEYCVLGGYTGTEPLRIRNDRVDQLNGILDRYRITATLSGVREMPSRTVSTRRVDLLPQQVRLYNELRDTLRLELRLADDATFSSRVSTYVARMLRLQEIAAGFARNVDGDVVYLPSAKTQELLELLEDPTPTIVWTWWVPEYEEVCRVLDQRGLRFSRLNDPGGRDQFLRGDVDVLVAQIASGGFGLNLDRAVRSIYHSLSFDAELMAQSLDRNWRWTTEQDKHVIYLLARGTIDEHVRTRLQEKAGVASTLTRSEALSMLQ